MSLGSCAGCKSYSLQGKDENYKKNHQGLHAWLAKDTFPTKIVDHINRNSRKLYSTKKAFLEEYFGRLHERINHVKQTAVNQLRDQILEVAFPNYSVELVRLAETASTGKLDNLRCSDVHRINETINEEQFDDQPYLQTLKQILKDVKEVVEEVEDDYRQKKQMKKQHPLKAPVKKGKVYLISELPEKGEYSVQVTIKQFITSFMRKQGEMKVYRGTDQSQKTVQITAPKQIGLQLRSQYFLERCETKFHKGKKQISVIKGSAYEEIHPNRHKHKEEGNRRRDRGQDTFYGKKVEERQEKPRRRPNRDESKEKSHQTERSYQRDMEKETDRRRGIVRGRGRINNERKNDSQVKKNFRMQKDEVKLQTTKIIDIGPGDEDLTINVKVIQVKYQIGKNLSCKIGDQTGIVDALLPSHLEEIREGSFLLITKAEACVQSEHIVIKLDRNSAIRKSPQRIERINFQVDISKPSYVIASDSD